MTLEQFKKNLTTLRNNLESVKKNSLNLTPSSISDVSDFESTRNVHIQNSVKTYFNLIRQEDLSNELDPEMKSQIKTTIENMSTHYANNDVSNMERSLEKLAEIIADINTPVADKFITKPKNVSDEIREEIYADIDELDKCFTAGCYRSAVILCGRILEVVLHRKAFDVTGQDYLEKSPGMGLGKIIAKLKEKDVPIDPALNQQIHLINQVRIFSVHKKQEAFYPSKGQAQAVILYTLDVIEKLFR